MRFIAITMFILMASRAGAQNSLLFKFMLPPGPNAVGLKVVEQYDYSRTLYGATDDIGRLYVGERARPLQTLVWYPARADSAKPMTVADYAALLATETSFDEPKPSKEKSAIWVDVMGPSLSGRLRAIRDAVPVAGHFPIIIYAPSFGARAWENADLCEYLASFGYVVIASPSIGAKGRQMTQDIAGLSAQARDISFLIGYAKSLPNVDLNAIAVAGFSWGGYANLFAAARDSRIDALVCFDGSLRYFPALAKEAGDVNPKQMTIPMMYFSQGEISIEDMSSMKLDAPNILNEWTHGDLFDIDMLGMMHWEYSAMYQRSEDKWQQWYPVMRKGDYDRQDGIADYAWVATYTLHFLDLYLKHELAAMRYLKRLPSENGVPSHLMTVKYRQALSPAPSLETFRAELGVHGFGNAAEVYSALQKANPDFAITEGSIESWGREMVFSGHSKEAIELLQWNAKVYGKSAAAFNSLGDAFRLSGQEQPAATAYKRSLELSPDPLVAQKLKALGGNNSN